MSKIKVDVLETVDGTKSVNVSDLGTGTITRDVTFTGAGRRITGTFGGVPVANRTLFQTTVANDPTTVGIIPNGTGDAAYLQFSNSSDPDNGGYGFVGLTSSEFVITSTALGSGTKPPINIDGKLSIGLDGSVLATGGALGYGPGAGGTMTQATSKSTAVTLNKPSGRITMNGAALGAGASVVFVVYNTSLGPGDTVSLAVVIGTVSDSANYRVEPAGIGFIGPNMAFAVRVTNVSAGSLSENVGINFALHKGSTS